ncbi:MAG: F0F1 ATP synthase subunit B [Eubacteriales bacterium]
MDYQALVGIAPWTFIAQICNLFITMMLFKKFLFAPVKKVIADRQAQVDSLYLDAETAKTAALESQTSYEALLTGAKTEAAELVRTATATAQSRGDQMVREAKEEATAIKNKATADIALEKKKALNQVKNEISEIAMDIASKVVEREIDQKDHQKLVEEFIEKMGEDG